MNFIKKFSPLVLGFMLMASAALAQNQQSQPVQPAEEVTDQEVQQLVLLAMESQTIQRDVNMQMQKAINAEENINMQRFQLIQQSKRNPQLADSIKVSEEEKAAIKNLQPKLEKISVKAQNKMKKVLDENELTEQRLKEIQLALRSDKELQQRFQKEMIKQQKEKNSQ